MPKARSATKMIAADAQPPRTALRSWRALPSPKAAAKASHRGASRHRVDQNVKSSFFFGQIAQMEHMVQPGALRWVPARAGVPREGRGEAPVQHPKPNSRANSHHNPPFSPGGGARGGERAPPPRRRRRAALGPMPYGNSLTVDLLTAAGNSSTSHYATLLASFSFCWCSARSDARFPRQ